MIRKKSYNYFEGFKKMGDYACQAAKSLSKAVADYDADQLGNCLQKLHDIEQTADQQHHEIRRHLAVEFITPIEREDILLIAQELDEVVDCIEDVLLRIYMFNIPYMPQEAMALTNIIEKCCASLVVALDDFENFKKNPQAIHENIVLVNEMEEEGDAIFTKAMRKLCTNCKDPLRLLAWTTTYNFMEKCCDACEHVANAMESIIMKNA